MRMAQGSSIEHHSNIFKSSFVTATPFFSHVAVTRWCFQKGTFFYKCNTCTYILEDLPQPRKKVLKPKLNVSLSLWTKQLVTSGLSLSQHLRAETTSLFYS